MTDEQPGRVDRSPAGVARRVALDLGRPAPRDVVSGLVTGLFSIPEGMAYANIGGFSPVAGLYAGMVPTAVGSVLARTVLMVTTLTSAIALSSQSVLSSAGLDPTDPANIAALTVMVGVVMAAMGLLRFGSVMSFVSNAVMTGFTTGIALQIVVGVLGDATGYEPDRHNTLVKLVDSIVHVGRWDATTVAVTAATVAVWAVLRFVGPLKPLASLATLISLVVVTAAVVVFDLDIADVGDIASIAHALPPFSAPALDAVPKVAVGAVAVALVALAQAAGISAAVPNPDGRPAGSSGDFTAQGVANVAGGLFGALPTGGSLSRTGVATSAGARTRWAGIFAGLWLIALVLVAGPVAEVIPMAVIGGLLLVIGGELITGRLPDIRLVTRTSPMSMAAMVVTFAATTELPLQNAIFIGAGLSLVLYCVQAARAGRLVAVEPVDGHWKVTDVPARCPSGAVTVLHYQGIGLFAEVPRIDGHWPDTTDTHGAAVIISIRTVPDVPSSAVVKAFERRARQLQANGNTLYLAGVTPELAHILERSGLTDLVGADHVIAATPVILESVNTAFELATAWVEQASSDPDQTPSTD